MSMGKKDTDFTGERGALSASAPIDYAALAAAAGQSYSGGGEGGAAADPHAPSAPPHQEEEGAIDLESLLPSEKEMRDVLQSTRNRFMTGFAGHGAADGRPHLLKFLHAVNQCVTGRSPPTVFQEILDRLLISQPESGDKNRYFYDIVWANMTEAPSSASFKWQEPLEGLERPKNHTQDMLVIYLYILEMIYRRGDVSAQGRVKEHIKDSFRINMKIIDTNYRDITPLFAPTTLAVQYGLSGVLNYLLEAIPKCEFDPLLHPKPKEDRTRSGDYNVRVTLPKKWRYARVLTLESAVKESDDVEIMTLYVKNLSDNNFYRWVENAVRDSKPKELRAFLEVCRAQGINLNELVISVDNAPVNFMSYIVSFPETHELLAVCLEYGPNLEPMLRQAVVMHNATGVQLLIDRSAQITEEVRDLVKRDRSPQMAPVQAIVNRALGASDPAPPEYGDDDGAAAAAAAASASLPELVTYDAQQALEAAQRMAEAAQTRAAQLAQKNEHLAEANARQAEEIAALKAQLAALQAATQKQAAASTAAPQAKPAEKVTVADIPAAPLPVPLRTSAQLRGVLPTLGGGLFFTAAPATTKPQKQKDPAASLS